MSPSPYVEAHQAGQEREEEVDLRHRGLIGSSLAAGPTFMVLLVGLPGCDWWWGAVTRALRSPGRDKS